MLNVFTDVSQICKYWSILIHKHDNELRLLGKCDWQMLYVLYCQIQTVQFVHRIFAKQYPIPRQIGYAADVVGVTYYSN